VKSRFFIFLASCLAAIAASSLVYWILQSLDLRGRAVTYPCMVITFIAVLIFSSIVVRLSIMSVAQLKAHSSEFDRRELRSDFPQKPGEFAIRTGSSFYSFGPMVTGFLLAFGLLSLTSLYLLFWELTLSAARPLTEQTRVSELLLRALLHLLWLSLLAFVIGSILDFAARPTAHN
jgi:hypothetical protein